MSDLPKILVPRPGELREAVMRWLVEVDDHLTTEEPAEGYNPGGVLPDK